MARTYPMAFVTPPGRIEYRERALPDLQSSGVLVKVKAASICGGDLHLSSLQQAFELLLDPHSGAIKVVIQMD